MASFCCSQQSGTGVTYTISGAGAQQPWFPTSDAELRETPEVESPASSASNGPLFSKLEALPSALPSSHPGRYRDSHRDWGFDFYLNQVTDSLLDGEEDVLASLSSSNSALDQFLSRLRSSNIIRALSPTTAAALQYRIREVIRRRSHGAGAGRQARRIETRVCGGVKSLPPATGSSRLYTLGQESSPTLASGPQKAARTVDAIVTGARASLILSESQLPTLPAQPLGSLSPLLSAVHDNAIPVTDTNRSIPLGYYRADLKGQSPHLHWRLGRDMGASGNTLEVMSTVWNSSGGLMLPLPVATAPARKGGETGKLEAVIGWEQLVHKRQWGSDSPVHPLESDALLQRLSFRPECSDAYVPQHKRLRGDFECRYTALGGSSIPLDGFELRHKAVAGGLSQRCLGKGLTVPMSSSGGRAAADVAGWDATSRTESVKLFGVCVAPAMQ